MSKIKLTDNGFEIDIENEVSLEEGMLLHDSFEFKFHGGHIMKVIRVPNGLMYVNPNTGEFKFVEF